MSSTIVKCTVTGLVQGVYYRAATAERARELELDGWVRNLPDGQVELVVSGESAGVEQFLAWLWQGPPAARVSAVTLADYAEPVARGFAIRR